VPPSARLGGAAFALLLGAAGGCGTAQQSANPAPGPNALYVTNWKSNEISSFPLRADGTISGHASTTTTASGTSHPQGSVRSANGRWLYVGNWGSGDVSAYQIRNDGSLSARSSAKVKYPEPVTPSAIALSPNGTDIYTANYSNGAEGTVSHYRTTPGGELSAVSTISAHGKATTGLTISPDGRTLLTANSGSGDVSLFSVGADGGLRWQSTTKTGAGAFVAKIAPDGAHAIVTNSLADTISLIDISSPLSPKVLETVPSTEQEPRGVVIDKTGRFAYVSDFANGTGPGSATVFEIAGSRFRFAGVADTGSNGSEGLALAANQQTLYVANFNKHGQGSVTSIHLRRGLFGHAERPVLTGGREPDLGSITVPPVG
jgi:6-phosphogluconolactonase (cycloisomerase 2 family)